MIGPADTPELPPLDARTLGARRLFTLTTSEGNLDVIADPDPNFDHEVLRTTAASTTTAGQPLLP